MNQNPNSLHFGARLSQWKSFRCLNRKPKTVAFYSEWHAAILRAWPDVDVPMETVTADWVVLFASKLAHFCPSRWNAVVAFLREHTMHGKLLRRRADKPRDFTPPSQQEFTRLLAECDAARGGSTAGIVARFLSHTGLRISEARALRWENVFEDRIEVPTSAAAKNGRHRSIPHLPGVAPVLEKLRSQDNGGFVLPRASARKAIASASQRALGRHWSWHCFRHLFATRCIQSGVDMPTTARWLGHKDGGALLARTYFHLVDAHSREMALKVRIAA